MGGEIWPLKVLMLLLLSKNEVAMMHEKKPAHLVPKRHGLPCCESSKKCSDVIDPNQSIG
jgi:hypothetical protein